MEKYNSILSKKITTEEEEYKMFYEFYENVFQEINYPILKNAKLYEYFDKIYISSVYGVQKKEKVFFDYPIQDYKIKESEAIFVDDNEELLDIASEKGLEVRLMNREKEKINSKYKVINNLLTI